MVTLVSTLPLFYRVALDSDFGVLGSTFVFRIASAQYSPGLSFIIKLRSSLWRWRITSCRIVQAFTSRTLKSNVVNGCFKGHFGFVAAENRSAMRLKHSIALCT